MWGESSQPATLTLVVLGAGLLLYLPARPPNAPEPQGTGKTDRADLLLNCSSLEEVTDLEWIASGWTKAVYRGRLRGRDIAVKTVNLDGHDIESCLSRPEAPSLARCYRRTSAKILRELILLQELQHPNVVKVLGSCIPDAVGPVVIATELGEPLDSVALLQLSWEERLKVAQSVASLLHLLAHSPLGSLAAPDLKRHQFVLVDGQLKLADVDDLGISEPTCRSHSDCSLQTDLGNDRVICVFGRCRGHNEQSNILRAGEDLLRHVLLEPGPQGLENQVSMILAAFKGKVRWDTDRILRETEELVRQSR